MLPSAYDMLYEQLGACLKCMSMYSVYRDIIFNQTNILCVGKYREKYNEDSRINIDLRLTKSAMSDSNLYSARCYGYLPERDNTKLLLNISTMISTQGVVINLIIWKCNQKRWS